MSSDWIPEFNLQLQCSEAEWLRRLPDAVGGCRWTLMRPGKARVAVGGGTLTLRWHALPPRHTASGEVARLSVHCLFNGVGDGEREAFMRRFGQAMTPGES